MSTENPASEIAAKTSERQLQVEAFNKKKAKVSDLINSYKSQIAQALPKMLTPDRMIRTCLTAMMRNPDLLDCTGHSLISCILTSSQLGLMPDNVLGECYLIPFNNTAKGNKECTFIIGYKGLLTLALRSGQVQSITAQAVYAANEPGGDVFDYDLGLNEKLEHKPSGMSDPAKITHFYAIVRMKGGGHVFNVMTRAQVEAVRNESKNYKFSKYKEKTVWGLYFEEMGKKTLLRRLMKYVPLSPEVANVIALDESADAGKQNISLNFVEEIPEFTEDVTAEVLGEQDYNDGEHQDQVNQERQEKGEKAVQATLELLGDKVKPK